MSEKITKIEESNESIEEVRPIEIILENGDKYTLEFDRDTV